jgi:hypothetical protein
MEAFGGVQVVRITFWRVSSLATVVFAASPVHRFPCKIIFRAVGQNILIFRILHGAQNHPRENQK